MINTYSPSDVILHIDAWVVEAWEKISIKRNTPSYTFVKGIRGKNTRVGNFDTSVLLEIDVMQTSETNDILNQIHTADVYGTPIDGGVVANNGRLTLTLRDRSGTSVFQLEDAYIVGFPETSYSDSIGTRTWTIQSLSSTEFKVGGNLRPPSNITESIFSKINSIGS